MNNERIQTGRILLSAIIGCCTGLLSASISLQPWMLPGLFFGLSFLVWRRPLIIQLLVALSSYVAFYVAFHVWDTFNSMNTNSFLSFFLSGTVGAAILWVTLAVSLSTELNLGWFLRTILLGGILALPFVYFVNKSDSNWVDLALPFAFWQALMAGWLTNLVERRVILNRNIIT